MKHFTFILILVLIAALSFVPLMFSSNDFDTKTAMIYRNNELLYSINLSEVTSPYEILIEYGNASNTILIDKNKVSMKSANCPDKLCVGQGTVSDGLIPITCLPNNIVIKIVGSNIDRSVDAVSR